MPGHYGQKPALSNKTLAELDVELEERFGKLYGDEDGKKYHQVAKDNGLFDLYLIEEASTEQKSPGRAAADEFQKLRFKPGPNRRTLREHLEKQGLVFDATPRKSGLYEQPTTHKLVYNTQGDGGWDALPINAPITTQRWEGPYEDANTGRLVMYDPASNQTREIPENLQSLNKRPDITKDDVQPLTTITLEDETVVEYYDVGGKIVEYRSKKDDSTQVVDPSKNAVTVDGGVFYNVGPNRYDFVPDKTKPFTPSQSIDVPDLNGTMLQTSPNQWQFVRNTYEPGVKVDPRTGIRFVQDPNGTWR